MEMPYEKSIDGAKRTERVSIYASPYEKQLLKACKDTKSLGGYLFNLVAQDAKKRKIKC